ncbi:MAG: CPBP family intramembrane metalloprotease [Proteiniphilum sp.]|nr:CPBP family intramembrane metalloprotease [Proteiniphilum sp.]
MKPVFSLFAPGDRIAWLFLFLLAGVTATAGVMAVIPAIPGMGDGVSAVYAGMVVQSALTAALPAYLVAALTHPAPARCLRMTGNAPGGEGVILAVLIFISSYMLVSFLSQWNRGMKLPASMHEVEQMMRSMEDAALETSSLLLSGRSAGRLILNLLIVGGVAALSEEMFFRGALQQFIHERYARGHVAVWVSALVFSAVHFQFYGFLPRLLLGGLLGCLFLYTRNLWIAVLFHFINNALIIVLHYLPGGGEWMRRMEDMPVSGRFALAAAVSALSTFFLFRIYRRRNPDASQAGGG